MVEDIEFFDVQFKIWVFYYFLCYFYFKYYVVLVFYCEYCFFDVGF